MTRDRCHRHHRPVVLLQHRLPQDRYFQYPLRRVQLQVPAWKKCWAFPVDAFALRSAHPLRAQRQCCLDPSRRPVVVLTVQQQPA